MAALALDYLLKTFLWGGHGWIASALGQGPMPETTWPSKAVTVTHASVFCYLICQSPQFSDIVLIAAGVVGNTPIIPPGDCFE